MFERSEEFLIEQSKEVDQLSFLGPQFIITFQLYITSVGISSGHYSIISFTINKSIWQYYGDQTPAVALKGFGRATLDVRAAINGNSNFEVPIGGPDLVLNTWHTLEFSQLMDENEVQ